MPSDCQEMVMMGTNPSALPAYCQNPNSAAAAATTTTTTTETTAEDEAKWNAVGKTKPVFPATTDEECKYIMRLIATADPKYHTLDTQGNLIMNPGAFLHEN